MPVLNDSGSVKIANSRIKSIRYFCPRGEHSASVAKETIDVLFLRDVCVPVSEVGYGSRNQQEKHLVGAGKCAESTI